LQLSSKILQRH